MSDEHIEISVHDVITKLEQLLQGVISREEVQAWTRTVKRSYSPAGNSINHLSHFDAEAFRALAGACLGNDLKSAGAPYFYRMEDFVEHLAILRREDATFVTAAGLRQLRYYQLRPMFPHPIALFTVSADEVATRNNLPCIRSVDQLGDTKTIFVQTPENKQYILIENLQSPRPNTVDLHIEASAENDTVEIEHVMQSLHIEPHQLYWRTEYFYELKQQFESRKVSQQSGQQ